MISFECPLRMSIPPNPIPIIMPPNPPIPIPPIPRFGRYSSKSSRSLPRSLSVIRDTLTVSVSLVHLIKYYKQSEDHLLVADASVRKVSSLISSSCAFLRISYWLKRSRLFLTLMFYRTNSASLFLNSLFSCICADLPAWISTFENYNSFLRTSS